jgi:hypothetical protein
LGKDNLGEVVRAGFQKLTLSQKQMRAEIARYINEKVHMPIFAFRLAFVGDIDTFSAMPNEMSPVGFSTGS